MAHKEHPLLSPKNFWPASSYLLLLGVLAAVLVELNKEHHVLPLEWFAALLVGVAVVGGIQFHRRLRKILNTRVDRYEVVEKPIRRAGALITHVSQGGGRRAEFGVAGGGVSRVRITDVPAAQATK